MWKLELTFNFKTYFKNMYVVVRDKSSYGQQPTDED